MRRTLTVVAATAALLLPGGPLPAAGTASAEAAAGLWSAREAAAFWTPERMASALPVPDAPADPRASGLPVPDPTGSSGAVPGLAGPGSVVPDAAGPGTDVPGSVSPGSVSPDVRAPVGAPPGQTATGRGPGADSANGPRSPEAGSGAERTDVAPATDAPAGPAPVAEPPADAAAAPPAPADATASTGPARPGEAIPPAPAPGTPEPGSAPAVPGATDTTEPPTTPAPAAPALPGAPAGPSPSVTPVDPLTPATPATPATPTGSAVPTPGSVPEPAPVATGATPSRPAPAPRPAQPAPKPTPKPVAAPIPPSARAGVGKDFDGSPTVGRMFVMKGGGAYFCTASVVSSPGRNLVLSAAHCLLGPDSRQVAFVPRYTKAKPQPYGMFPVLRDAGGRPRMWIDPRYRREGADRAATLDVAFARVGPNSRGTAVETVVGGNRLVTGATFTHARVTLIGYPSAAARPRVCFNRTTKFTSREAKIPGSFLRIACTGYPGGTSGGPFLTRYNQRTGTGDVVGVIGGWKTGGTTPDTSYSSYFGAQIRKLYQAAVAGARVG
ncbi:hypothetical protein NJL88_01720 [Streptomyces sp. DK15]|uniref:hypothetical protein n=1 Tax=Streptomyces sp. DK15 TaxID=2957499 RepID=UPI0029B75958|nr:hypothetical protein [Streptomyces sp. DK15]MDX2388822.1 hypothetical protein [Streptomyces sp. DK15]